MEANFWHQKWEKNEIAFHQSKANPLLIEYFPPLNLQPGSRVFLPLCGKTLDMAWLLGQGYQVAGAELSKIAVEQLFNQLGVEPQISQLGEIEHYSAVNIDLFVGDIFHLSSTMLGKVNAVYDRAALVALPEAMRTRYSAHLMQITDTAPQLLICYEYDQSAMAGPPFSVRHAEVKQQYATRYALNLLLSAELAGGLKGKCPAIEHVWHLQTL
jgi:thiopurine S-methyltransferase